MRTPQTSSLVCFAAVEASDGDSAEAALKAYNRRPSPPQPKALRLFDPIAWLPAELVQHARGRAATDARASDLV